MFVSNIAPNFASGFVSFRESQATGTTSFGKPSGCAGPGFIIICIIAGVIPGGSFAPGGIFDVVLPCEGGAAYWLARRMSAQPMFERRFRLPYKDIIANEHVNTIYEILPLLETRFSLMWKSFFPLPVPSYFANLCVAQRFVKR